MTLLQPRFLLSALKRWRVNRAQALLSTLGVMAGVSGLVVVVALGDGAARELRAALGSLGAGSVILRDSAAEPAEGLLQQRHGARIEDLAGDTLRRASMARFSRAPVNSAQARLDNIQIIATDRQYLPIFRLSLYAGRFLTEHDVARGQRVCILSWDLARTLFPNGQVIGRQVRIGSDWYRVVGWLASESRELPRLDALNLSERSRSVYIPLERALTPGMETHVDEIVLQFENESTLASALQLIKRIVAADAREGGIDYIVPLELLRQKQAVQQLFQYFLLGVAALMLTVGGIGIMNMMMVNVISRRSEIGLRLAVGATRRDITAQFVTESLVIATGGGVLGILAGYLIATLVDWTSQWPIAYSPEAALIGFAVSVTVGVVFGSYPALQAASVSPLQSLNRL